MHVRSMVTAIVLAAAMAGIATQAEAKVATVACLDVNKWANGSTSYSATYTDGTTKSLTKDQAVAYAFLGTGGCPQEVYK